MNFEELCLDTRILRAVTEMGFEQASPIQAQAIPVAIEGKDMIGQAQTGTGKTAAFGIPLLQRVDPHNKKLQAVVLCPTRELAIQCANEMRKFAKFMHGIKVLPIYGGQDITKQIRSLKGGTQVVIGTPGRVIDHIRRHTLKMATVGTIVLDEADEMLNMGFREDIETVLQTLPEEHQTLLFSATMPKPIMEIAKTYLKEPEIIKVVKKELTVPKIEQYYYEVNPRKKAEVLSRLLDMYDPELSLVFCNTKRKVDELVEELKGRGYFAAGLHGDLKQSQRDRVMNGFRNGRTDILVATDVAARGIDVDDVEAVFNYDVPQDDEYYVHRIGRTGRAGREGKAFSLVVGKEVYKLRDIQRYCKTKIIPQAIPSLNDITEIKADKILDQVQDILNDADLTKIVNIIEKKLMEDDYTSLDLAAALLKMSMGDDNEDIIDNYMPARSLDDLDSYGRNSRGRDRGRNNSRRKGATDRAAVDYVLNGGEERMARLFINIGKSQRVTPGDILGAVAGESGIPGRLVGSIDMYDGYTFVDVPAEYAEDVLNAMSHARIKGKHIHVEKANSKR